MRCRIIYAGNMIPIFTLDQSQHRGHVIAANISTSDNRTVTITMTFSVIRQLLSDDNGVIFKCKITFQLPNNSEGNAPDYEYTWNYTANVLCKYCFINATILPFNLSFPIGNFAHIPTSSHV